MITKKQLADGDIISVSQFLTPKEKTDLWLRCNNCTWKYSDVVNAYSAGKQFRMVHAFDSELFVRTDIWKRLEESFDTQLALFTSYIIYSTPGFLNIPHCDGDQNGPSILICLNQEWRRDWGGYTVFFKDMDSNEVVKTIVPEPGKATIFGGGAVWHSSLAVDNCAPYPRFMLSIHCSIE